MLILQIHNDSTGLGQMANYNVRVKVNERTIWTGRVEDHWRPDGWQNLVRKIADAATGKTQSDRDPSSPTASPELPSH